MGAVSPFLASTSSPATVSRLALLAAATNLRRLQVACDPAMGAGDATDPVSPTAEGDCPMRERRSLFAVLPALALVVVFAGNASALELPAVIGSNMVLQRGVEIPIWGWAAPGEKVSVSFGAASAEATTGDDGRWSVKLPPLAAGGPHQIVVKGRGQAISLDNVLVGEVWVCSGQSNMEWSIERSANPDAEIAAADHPQIRLFDVPKVPSGAPAKDVEAEWKVCTPESARHFSAVSYFFGRQLQKELGVPIGLIDSSWGGTRIEPWTPAVGLRSVAGLGSLADEIETARKQYSAAKVGAVDAVAAWLPRAQKAVAAGREVPEPPAWPSDPGNSHRVPMGLYNGMIYPLLPYSIRGAIWYQGESNMGEGMLYHEKMKALIKGWRQVWANADMPFYFVQLAPFHYRGRSPTALAEIWEAQAATLAMPNTGMAGTVDIGNVNDIHPKNKQDVGKRLALWALAKTYSKGDIVYSGPTYRSMSIEGSKARIHFDYVGGGLVARDERELNWFAVAGEDGEFHPARARIDGDTVVVESSAVAAPKAVRFGWHNEAEPNLSNREGLPAIPFRTQK